MRTKFVFCILICLSFFQSLDAQDAQFSQFGLNYSTYNPSMIGIFEGDLRIHVGYRDRWHSFAPENEFNVISVALDYKLSEEISNFSIGFNTIQDWSGSTQLKQTKSYLTAGYLLQLTNGKYGVSSSFLGTGFQVGFGYSTVDPNGFWFGRQFNLETFQVDENISSGEDFGTEPLNAFYVGINLGLIWYTIHKKGGMHAGLAVSHINTPNISLIPKEIVKIARRYTVHAGLDRKFTQENSIQPSVIFNLQGKAYTGLFGTYFTNSLNYIGESGFSVGAWLKLSNHIERVMLEGLVLAAKFEHKNFEFGASYDVTLSSAGVFNSRMGGFELNFSYTRGRTLQNKILKRIPGL